MKLLVLGWFLTFECQTLLMTASITLLNAFNFDHQKTSTQQLESQAIVNITIASSGIIVWFLVVVRAFSWRWIAISIPRLNSVGQSAVAITTIWTAATLASSIIQVVRPGRAVLELNTTKIEIITVSLAGWLYSTCIATHVLVHIYLKQVQSSLCTYAPSFGAFYTDEELLGHE